MDSSVNIICGKTISENVINDLKKEISNLSKEFHCKPKLAVVQVGHHEASDNYIRFKNEAASRCEIEVMNIWFPSQTPSSEIQRKIENLNDDASVHGIIFQIPPDSMHDLCVETLINIIHPDKDVDGLTALQMSRLVTGEFLQKSNASQDDSCEVDFLTHLPCGAIACLLLLQHTGVPLLRGRCLLIGHGRLIGSPLTSLLLWTTQLTLVICQEGTSGLEKEVSEADFIISAAGRPELVKGEWIRPGCVVIDCGANTIPDDTNGLRRSVGDVEFDTAVLRAAWITPVPGGVGPVCIAMLLRNTLNAFKKSLRLPTHNPIPNL